MGTVLDAPRPQPSLEPSSVNIEQYWALTPEKLELLGGYLLGGPDDHRERRDLLLLLLVNEGLEAAVRLAPIELWREALHRVESLTQPPGQPKRSTA